MNKPYLNLQKNNLPGGTVDSSVEFFIHEGSVKCRTNGETYSYEDFPQWVLDKVDEKLAESPEKVGYIIDEFGLLDADGQRQQYIFCLHGSHDATPDIDKHGEVNEAEYVDCGRRCGACSVEGKLCNNIVLKKGVLRPSEIKVLAEIGNGLLDKEIADKLGISEHTIRHHKDAICQKSGLERKSTLSVLADRLGLTDIEI